MAMSGWVFFTAGRGPAECRLAVAGISHEFLQRFEGSSVVEATDSDVGLNSILIRVPDVSAVIPWIGTLEWVCKSPIRPNHQRKRWYIGTSVFNEPASSDVTVLPKDLIWETMRASGPGGQHVNKTESAVRLKHIPSGCVITCSEERSQFRNKALALAKMREVLANGLEKELADQTRSFWEAHNQLIRGNPMLSFKGPEFQLTFS